MRFLKRKFLFFLIKQKKFQALQKIVPLLFKKEGYWVVSQLLNRGFLYEADKLLKKLPYKKHFEYIFDRVNSMRYIITNGVTFNKVSKKKIKDIKPLFVVHNSLPYDKAGYAIRTHSIVTNLYKDGINPLVTTRPGYPWDIKKHKHLKKVSKYDIIDNIRYIRLEDKEKTFKRGSDFKYIETYANELVRIAKKENITILHAHSNYLNAWGAIKAGEILKIPVIYEIRGLWYLTRLTKEPDYKYGGMFEYEKQMVKYAAIYADKIVTISNALKELVVSWGINEKKIEVIPNAVDIDKFSDVRYDSLLANKYNLKTKKLVLGFIGSITAYEGLDVLIKATDELIKEGYDISLLIVGDGIEKKRFEKLSKSKDIIFVGRVEHSEVKRYYSVIDVCVYARNDFEVCRYVPPLKPLEAMAMQKPIIVSNVPPLLEIIQDNHTGLVCKADDIKSLANAIKTLCDDTSFAQNLAYNAREWVCKHRDIKDLGKVYHEIYQTFL
jgi:glycosyltransferase involved in cell wall biosynthesis